MKRKHSTCLGIACLYCVLFATFFFYDNSQFLAFEELLMFLFQSPFVITFALGFICVLITFFTNIGGLAIVAGILFGVDIVISLRYLVYMIPLVLITFVGCACCYKYKKMSKEQEERREQRRSSRTRHYDTSFEHYDQHQDLRDHHFHQDFYGSQNTQSNAYQNNRAKYATTAAKHNFSLIEDTAPQYPDHYYKQDNEGKDQDLRYVSRNFLQNREEMSFQPSQVQNIVNEVSQAREMDYSEITPSLNANNGFFDDFGNFQIEGTR